MECQINFSSAESRHQNDDNGYNDDNKKDNKYIYNWSRGKTVSSNICIRNLVAQRFLSVALAADGLFRHPDCRDFPTF